MNVFIVLATDLNVVQDIQNCLITVNFIQNVHIARVTLFEIFGREQNTLGGASQS